MRRFHVLFALLLAVLFVVTSCAEPQQPALEVTPATSTLVSLESTQLTVTRRFAGGGPVEQVTQQVTYSTSNRNVATVSNEGLVTAGDDPGTVVIRVYDPANDAVGTATFTVSAPRIESIDIVPSPAVVLRPGTSLKLTANARMNDGTTRDVTNQVLWASSNVAAATVALTPPDNGLVNAISIGETTITATDSATLVQGRTIVFVSGEAPQLRAITVTPNPATIPVGQTAQLSALGVYDDGSTKDVTSTLTWSSSSDAIVTVSSSGLATGVAAGQATVTAAGAGSAASVKGSAAVVVQ
jgi:uncharacterized protein YjdB